MFVGETDHLLVGTGGFIDRLIDFLSNDSGEGFLSKNKKELKFFLQECIHALKKKLILGILV